MSHLATLVERAKRLEPQGLRSDLFKRTVSNLAEYMVTWRDYTPAEKAAADELVTRYPEAVDRKMVGAIERDQAYQQEKAAMEKNVKVEDVTPKP